MRTHFLILTLAVSIVLVGCATGQASTQHRIPARFHGDWSSDLARCGDRESGRNLRIDANSITYFEAGDTVVATAPLPNGGISVLVDHEDYDGMGRLHRILVLSDNDQKLSFINDDTPGDVVLRCPQGNTDVR